MPATQDETDRSQPATAAKQVVGIPARRRNMEERDHGTCAEHWVRLRANGTCDLCE